MRQIALCLGLGLLVAGCYPLDIPEPPGAGSIQGTVVFTAPGRDKAPAGGAIIELIGTSLTATADRSTGFFQLSPIPVSSGSLLIRYDSDGDGKVDRARTISLESVKAGPGKVIVLGEIVLAGTSSLRGTVLRADSLVSTTGHGGTSVFTPAGPYLVYTGDNGAFGIDGLPEGEVTLAFFRAGFRSQQTTITMRAGETFSLPTILLTPEAGGAVLPVVVSGTATLFGASTSSGIKVTTNVGATTTTAADGTWSLTMEPGVYVFGFEKEGYGSVTLRNIVVTGQSFQTPAVVLTPGTSTRPDLDAGAPYDGGMTVVVDAGTGDAGIDAGTDVDAGTDAGFDAGVVDAGSDAGTDAGVVDAGFDAGVVDAGFDAGVVDAGFDAGVVDAGFDAGVADAGFDAGVVDAGFDAGVVDAGFDAGVADAGFDAGLPVALIDPLVPAWRPLNTTVQLVGTNSLGTRPFTYSWTQTRGPSVSLSANNSVTAATPTFSSGNQANLYGFTLRVTDTFGRVSAPSDELVIPVGTAPTANIANPGLTTVYANQVVSLEGGGSTDPNGSGIAQYIWLVSPAGVVTTQQQGTRLTLTMPATVTTPVALSVSLQVINGLGIPSSTAANVSFVLTNATAPAWYVDAGTGQTVNGGTVVTLNGLAITPGFTIPDGGVTYQWSPAADPDGGWALTNPNSPVTTFVAPVIVGPNQLLNFTLTATTDAGLTPSVNVGSTFVNVLDRTPPVVVGTSISGGRAGTLGLTVDFSEPVTLSSINNISISGAGGTIGSRSLTNKGTRAVLLTGPMSDGASYTLNIQQVNDTSPQANPVAMQNLPFVAKTYISPAFESVQTTSADPRPGGALRRPNDAAQFEMLAWGRDGLVPLFLQPFDPESCDAGPCPIATDVTAPSPTLTPLLTRGPRTVRVGETIYATAQPRDFINDAGQVTFARRADTWEQISPPGHLFTDGPALFAIAVESGLRVLTANTDGGWALYDAGIATTDGTFYATDSTSDPFTVGAWASPSMGGTLYITGKGSKSADSRTYKLSPPTSWSQFTPSSGLNVTDLRVVNPSGSAFLFGSHPNGSLDYTIFGGANNFATLASSGVSGFDAILRGSTIYWAMSVNGQLLVRWNNNGSQAVLPGPGGDAFNHNPTCFADSPEFTVLDEKLGLTWAERCGTGPWRIYFRLLN